MPVKYVPNAGGWLMMACAIALGALLSVTGIPLQRHELLAFAAAQPTAATVWDGIYTEAQARRGEQAYNLSCGYCHKDDLSGGFFDDGTGRAPALAGPRAFDSSFEERWGTHTVGQMLIDIGSIMPLQDPGSLTLQAYTDIISYLLAKNGVPPGTQELPADLDRLKDIRITPKAAR
jgi:mono/diheme cytochrome c family protein